MPISTYYAKHKVKKAEKDRLDDRLKFERELFLELVKCVSTSLKNCWPSLVFRSLFHGGLNHRTLRCWRVFFLCVSGGVYLRVFSWPEFAKMLANRGACLSNVDWSEHNFETLFSVLSRMFLRIDGGWLEEVLMYTGLAFSL